VTVTADVSSPGSPINESLIGVNHVVAGAGPALAAMGARWARTDVSFEITTGAGPAYNCATGRWNPTYLDSQVALDRAAEATPELIVDYTPPCLASHPPAGVNPNYTPPDLGVNEQRWRRLVYQMALHEITAEGVRVFEVWNEPNLGFFWTGGLNGYLGLYNDTVEPLERAARTAHVRIEVGGPALGEFSGINLTWISRLAADAKSHHVPLDFVSWHLYADNPDVGPSDTFSGGICPTGPPPPGLPCWYNPALVAQVYQRQTEQVRRVLSEYPSLRPVLWIDEWNIDAGEDARIDGPYGAAFAAAVLDSAQQAALGRMSFFDTADSALDPTQNWGLLHADLSPKPVYEAFAMWHELAGGQLPVHLDPDQTGADAVGRIGAIASIDASGTVHLLVYNFAPYDPSGGYGTSDPTPYDHPVTVDITGLRGCDGVSRSVIDADHPATVVETGTSCGSQFEDSFTLSGEGVTVLTLTPTSA